MSSCCWSLHQFMLVWHFLIFSKWMNFMLLHFLQIFNTVREEGAEDSFEYFPRLLRKLPALDTDYVCKVDGFCVKPCVAGAYSRYRATLQRTALSNYITGALLEATTSLGARSGLLSIFGGSAGRTMLKGRKDLILLKPVHFKYSKYCKIYTTI